MGAGGIACASVELADSAGYGAEVFLDQAHVSMDNLHPSVILCSETQERFMWVVHPELTPVILEHYNSTFDFPETSKGAEARVVGKIRNDKQYIVHSNGEIIIDAPAEQVTKGLLYNRPFSKADLDAAEPNISEPDDYNDVLQKYCLTKMSLHGNPFLRLTTSRFRVALEWKAVKRMQVSCSRSTAMISRKRFAPRALLFLQTIIPGTVKLTPTGGAVNAVAESMRNVAAVGAIPAAISDCLCFGNPEKEDQMGQFAEAARGVAEACKNIHLKDHPNEATPIIAGNVSFYNESRNGAIPPSPIIACVGKMEDATRAVTPHFKRDDSIVLMVGKRKNECGGSIYYALHNELGSNVPQPDFTEIEAQIFAVTDAISASLVLSCHDISEGASLLLWQR